MGFFDYSDPVGWICYLPDGSCLGRVEKIERNGTLIGRNWAGSLFRVPMGGFSLEVDDTLLVSEYEEM